VLITLHLHSPTVPANERIAARALAKTPSPKTGRFRHSSSPPRTRAPLYFRLERASSIASATSPQSWRAEQCQQHHLPPCIPKFVPCTGLDHAFWPVFIQVALVTPFESRRAFICTAYHWNTWNTAGSHWIVGRQEQIIREDGSIGGIRGTRMSTSD